jgi:hypothetical protein
MNAASAAIAIGGGIAIGDDVDRRIPARAIL